MNESSKNERTLIRNYKYSFVNYIATKKVIFLCGIRYTILLALTIDGFIAYDIIKGSCSKKRFHIFILSQVVSILIYI